MTISKFQSYILEKAGIREFGIEIDATGNGWLIYFNEYADTG